MSYETGSGDGTAIFDESRNLQREIDADMAGVLCQVGRSPVFYKVFVSIDRGRMSPCIMISTQHLLIVVGEFMQKNWINFPKIIEMPDPCRFTINTLGDSFADWQY